MWQKFTFKSVVFQEFTKLSYANYTSPYVMFSFLTSNAYITDTDVNDFLQLFSHSSTFLFKYSRST